MIRAHGHESGQWLPLWVPAAMAVGAVMGVAISAVLGRGVARWLDRRFPRDASRQDAADASPPELPVDNGDANRKG